jgi:hypothetical protein
MKLFVYIIFNSIFNSGKSVKVRKGTTRVFIRNSNQNIKYRNNALYDLHMIKLSRVIFVLFQIKNFFSAA